MKRRGAEPANQTLSGSVVQAVDEMADIRGIIRGSILTDEILGGAGAELIRSGRGNDDVVAGDGDDIVRAGRDNDRVDGGLGNDNVNGNA